MSNSGTHSGKRLKTEEQSSCSAHVALPPCYTLPCQDPPLASAPDVWHTQSVHYLDWCHVTRQACISLCQALAPELQAALLSQLALTQQARLAAFLDQASHTPALWLKPGQQGRGF